jgi:predicted ATPase
MKLNIKVENLGKFKKGEIKLRPLTVLTGENGTGKSFFTKMLYSIFTTLNKNIFHIDVIKNIKDIEDQLDVFKLMIQRISVGDKREILALNKSLNELKINLEKFQKESVTAYIFNANKLLDDSIACKNKFFEYLKYVEKSPVKVKLVKKTIKNIKQFFKNLEEKLEFGQSSYVKSLGSGLAANIKDNFQVAKLSELISIGEKECKITSNDKRLEVVFRENRIVVNIKDEFVNDVASLSRVVFFESPAYWSVRDALNNSKEVENKGDLTGVSKYFYDLDKTLNTKSTISVEETIPALATELRQKIGGEFKFENGQLTFTDNNGRNIDKNLISFGMTNLGMVQALLKNNVISEGSFVFFDEPETNLHPSWQVLLTDVLIKLAESGVNVVMATHSLDMIKALEVKTKDKNSDFIAVNHFTKDGTLFEFKDDNITNNLIESRSELANAYEELFLSELYQGE